MAERYIFKKYKADVFDIKSDIEVFVTQILSEETLSTHWKEIRNQVALNQIDLADEFERWNFYLFYIVNSPLVDLNLKYEIEHDTISSRKMVVKADILDEKLCDGLIKKYIKYDLENNEVAFNMVFEKNSMVESVVNHIKEEME